MTRCPGRRVGANRLTTGGPRALTCWHGEFHAFPELGYVAAGSAIAKASGAAQGGTLIALESGRSTLAFPSTPDIENVR